MFSFFSLWEFSQEMLTCSILSQNGEDLTRFFRWFILSISTPTMDRGRFSSHFRLSVDKSVFLLQSVRVLSKNADVHNFIWKWRRPRPFLWGDLSFQFQCHQWTGVNFPPKSFYPSIKCVFLLQYVRVFSNNADVHNFISKWRRPFGVIYPFNFNAHNGPGSIFRPHSFYPSIKCVFLLQYVRVFSNNADVHNFISKWRRPWTFLWGDLSFRFQRPQWTGVDFPATSFYPWIKYVFLLQSVRVFWKNADVDNFISKWRRPWPDFFGDLYFQFQCPNWNGVDFSPNSFYP